ncbi:antibiotic biosynthesis monooxygenase [Melittangium boletus]|uniref:antibiotic biosynthesis monooxygenase n=1 Tax=Melittangium boletus TaxID=83453 RepID=UPI003DA5C0E0
MMNSKVGPLYAIVRFDLKAGELDTVVSLIREFFEKEVSQVPGFISARLHSNEEGTVLINYATWASADAFHSFVTNVARVSPISQKIQAFSPRTDRVHEVAL